MIILIFIILYLISNVKILKNHNLLTNNMDNYLYNNVILYKM